MPRIIGLNPVNYQTGEVEILAPLSLEEMAEVMERANRGGYTCEASIIDHPPYNERIKLNDPNGEGYHRDYFATIE